MTPAVLAAKKYIESKKQADVLPSFSEAVQQAASQASKQQVGHMLPGLALGSFGVGAAGSGLVGLYNLLRRNMQGSAASTQGLGPISVDVPYPVAGPKKEKAADFLPSGEDIGKFFKGDMATSPTGIPWAIPALAGTAGLSGLAGYKAIKSLMESRRKSTLENDLNNARGNYDEALLAQFDKPKHTTVGKVAQQLELLWANIEKIPKEKVASTVGDIASSFGITPDIAGKMTGAYGLAAGGAGLLSAMAVSDMVKGRSRSALLADAQMRRQRALRSSSPTPIFARPTPVAPTEIERPHDEDEQSARELDSI